MAGTETFVARTTPDRRAIAAGAVTVLLWAIAFIGVRAAGRHFGAGPLALGRLLVATLTLAAFAAVRASRMGRPGARSRPSRTDLASVALCGALWFAAYNLALNEGERHVDAGTAAMLVNVGPILIAILAGVILREGFPRTLVRGLGVAFAGAIVIGLATGSRGSGGVLGATLCLAAALFYAGGVVAQKPALSRHSAVAVTLLACLVGMLLCLPFAPRLVAELGRAPAGAVVWVVWLGAFPTAVAFTTWAYALSRTTAGRMGALTYLVPPLAVLLGWVLLGEAPPPAALGGGVLCLAGVAITRGAGARGRGMHSTPSPDRRRA